MPGAHARASEDEAVARLRDRRRGQRSLAARCVSRGEAPCWESGAARAGTDGDADASDGRRLVGAPSVRDARTTWREFFARELMDAGAASGRVVRGRGLKATSIPEVKRSWLIEIRDWWIAAHPNIARMPTSADAGCVACGARPEVGVRERRAKSPRPDELALVRPRSAPWTISDVPIRTSARNFGVSYADHVGAHAEGGRPRSMRARRD